MKVHLRKRKLLNKKSGKPIYSLYLDIYYSKGKRKKEFLGLYINSSDDNTKRKEQLELAENIKARRQIELLNEAYGFPTREKQKQSFVEYFEYQSNKRQGNTKVTWLNCLKYLKHYSKGSIPFVNIDKTWLEGFQTLLLNSLSPSSASLYFSKIKCALEESVKDRILITNPIIQLPSIKVPQKEREFLMIDEIKLLLDTPCNNNEVKKAFVFSCFTGLRYSDIVALKWNQIKEFISTGNKVSYALQLTQTKTGNVLNIPLHPSAQKLLGNIQKNETLVFNLNTKHRNIQRILKNLLEVANIPKKVTFHTARHTYAIMLLANGANLLTVKELLGHRNIKSTQVYAKIIDDAKSVATFSLPYI